MFQPELISPSLAAAESPVRRYREKRPSASSSPRTPNLQAHKRENDASMDWEEDELNESITSIDLRPTRSTRKRQIGDRFIASRASFDVELAHYQLEAHASNVSLDTSPAKEEYKRQMGEQLFGAHHSPRISDVAGGGFAGIGGRSAFASATAATALSDASLLAIPPATLGGASSGATRCYRTIPRTPVHVLDAPEMLEDYYLNLLDWSKCNTVGIALNRAVYLWHATSGTITKLYEVPADSSTETSITSLRFTSTGDVIAVGTTNHDVQLWDVNTLQKLRTMRGHAGRVSVLAWHESTLASGSRDAQIHVHDARVAQHITARLSKHTQEVCGLTYSGDGLLASGGNDNLLCIWEGGRGTPRFAFDHHTAAVKGISFCPWQSALLASGGGTADRTLRFWDSSTGACLNSIDTKSQVCAVLWSTHYRELVSSHGYSQNQLAVWKYPSMSKVCELTGHTSRVLHVAMSPDGETVASASGDETLRFWRVFERRRSEHKPTDQRRSWFALPSMTIR